MNHATPTSRRAASHVPAIASAFLLCAACPAADEPASDTTGTGTGSSGESTSGATGSIDHTTTTDATHGSSTGGDSSSGGTLPACDCIAMIDDFPPFETTCEFDEPCEPIVVDCASADLMSCAFEDLTVVNPMVLACHAGQLAAGTAGLHRWELPYVTDPGVMGQRQYVFTLGDGQAITLHEAWADGAEYVISDATLVATRPATYFEACLDAGANEAIFACLYDVAESEQAVCIEGSTIPLG